MAFKWTDDLATGNAIIGSIAIPAIGLNDNRTIATKGATIAFPKEGTDCVSSDNSFSEMELPFNTKRLAIK